MRRQASQADFSNICCLIGEFDAAWMFTGIGYALGMLVAAARIFSAVLVVTGGVKIGRPENTARALRIAGFPYPRLSTAAIGVVEIVVGISGLLLGREVFWAQSAVYLAFGVWVLRAIRLGHVVESCGCVGKPDTPPYWGHVAINGAAVVFSLGAALMAVPSSAPQVIASVATFAVIGAGAMAIWVLLGDSARVVGVLRHR